jgi:hypothetical protein
VSQQQSLHALEIVDLDVVGKAPVLLEHLPHNRLRFDVFLPDPGMLRSEGVEGGFLNE